VILGDGYKIYWYCSSKKKKLGSAHREKRVQKASRGLLGLSSKLNKGRLK